MKGDEVRAGKNSSDLAVYSLIAAALGYTVLPFVGAVAAIITGHMALSEIRRSGGVLQGRGMALAGLILGYIQMGITVIGGLVALLTLVLGIASAVKYKSKEIRIPDVSINIQGNAGKTIEWAFGKAIEKDLGDLRAGLEAYRADLGSYPTVGQGLAALVRNPAPGVTKKWKGPYIRSLPRDPWGREYVYRPGAAAGRFALFSLGPDGQESEDDVGNK
jgi:type II secretion system protein G